MNRVVWVAVIFFWTFSVSAVTIPTPYCASDLKLMPRLDFLLSDEGAKHLEKRAPLIGEVATLRLRSLYEKMAKDETLRNALRTSRRSFVAEIKRAIELTTEESAKLVLQAELDLESATSPLDQNWVATPMTASVLTQGFPVKEVWLRVQNSKQKAWDSLESARSSFETHFPNSGFSITEAARSDVDPILGFCVIRLVVRPN